MKAILSDQEWISLIKKELGEPLAELVADACSKSYIFLHRILNIGISEITTVVYILLGRKEVYEYGFFRCSREA